MKFTLMSQAFHRLVTEVAGGETESVRVPLGDKKNNVNIQMPRYFNSTALIDSCYE
jgi:hypothetical protein